ncbi:MAG: dUTP diphosphatase [Oscillospiraceae bacterium]|jgi:dUTP pyrophosphatase|nr:dUTP diphosphatase [Oscillospiraceae bacterium]
MKIVNVRAKNQLKISLVRENAVIPKRATEGAAGMDLCACIQESLILEAGKRVLIPTGIAIEMPSSDYAALVLGRSGLGINYGITLSNSVGLIDSDYRGEIQVGLSNFSDEPYTIAPNERIAQLVVIKVEQLKIKAVTSLSETVRGVGGFGSSGQV